MTFHGGDDSKFEVQIVLGQEIEGGYEFAVFSFALNINLLFMIKNLIQEAP